VWGNAYKTTVSKLEFLQKRAVRIICNVSKLTHTSSFFHDLKLLKFKDLVDLKCGIVMYKAYHLQLPVNLQALFNFSKDLNSYTLRNNDTFHVNYARTSIKCKCISIYGVKLFNSLPKSLTSAKTVIIFKIRYKKHLSETNINF
jgi:hypothetical protein